MVGAFYMPRMVYINIHSLLSLPNLQFASGMGEIIKHGLIRDASYYQWLKDHQAAIQAHDEDILEEMVYGSCLIKKNVVETDPKEQGIRAYLNFSIPLDMPLKRCLIFLCIMGNAWQSVCTVEHICLSNGDISQKTSMRIFWR